MTPGPAATRSAAEIQSWIVEKLCERQLAAPDEIDLNSSLIAHGVDSVEFIALIGELEDWLGCRFRDNPLVRYPSIAALSEFLERRLAAGTTTIDPNDEPIE
jgi:acyl carrier protein